MTNSYHVISLKTLMLRASFYDVNMLGFGLGLGSGSELGLGLGLGLGSGFG